MIEQLKKNKITIIVTLVVVGFAAMLYSFMNPEKTSEPDVATDKLVEFNGTELEESKDGNLVWRLTADKIMIDPQTQNMYFINPKAVLYDVNGTEMTITAEKGTVDKKTQTIELKAPVQAATNVNDTLQTKGSVYYNMNTHLIKGGNVIINRHDNTSLRADAFETTTSLDKVTLTGHAQVTRGE